MKPLTSRIPYRRRWIRYQSPSVQAQRPGPGAVYVLLPRPPRTSSSSSAPDAPQPHPGRICPGHSRGGENRIFLPQCLRRSPEQGGPLRFALLDGKARKRLQRIGNAAPMSHLSTDGQALFKKGLGRAIVALRTDHIPQVVKRIGSTPRRFPISLWMARLSFKKGLGGGIVSP